MILCPLIATFTYVGAIRTVKYNRSDRDKKSNHGYQYNTELEFRYSSHLVLSNVYTLIRFVKLLACILFHSL